MAGQSGKTVVIPFFLSGHQIDTIGSSLSGGVLGLLATGSEGVVFGIRHLT